MLLFRRAGGSEVVKKIASRLPQNLVLRLENREQLFPAGFDRGFVNVKLTVGYLASCFRVPSESSSQSKHFSNGMSLLNPQRLTDLNSSL